jgi:hypothetical protein
MPSHLQELKFRQRNDWLYIIFRTKGSRPKNEERLYKYCVPSPSGIYAL